MPRLRPPQAQPEVELKTQSVDLTPPSDAQEPPKVIGQTQPELFEQKEPEQPEAFGEKVEEPAKEDPSLALKTELERLKKSEEFHRTQWEQSQRESQLARQQIQEREAEIEKFRKESQQSQLGEIQSRLESAEIVLAAAKQDLKAARMENNVEAEVDANEKLAEAAAQIQFWKQNKAAFEDYMKVPVQRQQNDPVAGYQISDVSKNWLRGHMEYVTDPKKNHQLNAAHYEAVEAGYKEGSPGYIEAVETSLGMRRKSEPEAPLQPAPEPRKPPIVSAPVSREVPTATRNDSATSVTLSAAQLEMANAAGITAAEYAKQLIKLRKLKAEGAYGEGR